MTDDLDIKTPRKVKRDGPEKTAPKAPIKKPSVNRPGLEPSGVPRPRPVVKTAAPPPSARPRPSGPGSGASAPAGVPQQKAPEAAAVRRPRTGRPVRREKSLEGLGKLLKTKREIHGLTRRDVVVKIKIPLEQLEAIEEGRLSSLPPVFAKGFLRAYANELGLDAESILEDYRQLTGGFKNEPASREPLAPRYVETSVGRSGGGLGPLAKLFIIGLVVLGLIGGLAYWLWPGISGSLGSLPFGDKISGLTGSGPDTSGGKSVTIPAGPSGGGDGSSFTIDGGQDEGDFVGDPIGEGTVISSIEVNRPASVPAGGILTLTSKMDGVWVEVQVDGGALQHLLMRNGQQVTWSARQSITLRAGQPNALSANWNGQEISPLSSEPSAILINFPQSG